MLTSVSSSQDGALAGQSVPHVHIHIIPRHAKDYEPLDQIYRDLEKVDLRPQEAKSTFVVDADEDRKPRTREEMTAEAGMLTKLFSSENQVDASADDE